MQLKIKNFGPIKKGYTNPQTDDFFDVHRCSVLIGEFWFGIDMIWGEFKQL